MCSAIGEVVRDLFGGLGSLPGLTMWDMWCINLQQDLCVFRVFGVPMSPVIVVDSIVNYNTENKVALINVDTFSGFSFYHSDLVMFFKIFLP